MARPIEESTWKRWQAQFENLKTGDRAFVFRRGFNNKNREVGLVCLMVEGKPIPVARMIEPSDSSRYEVMDVS